MAERNKTDESNEIKEIKEIKEEEKITNENGENIEEDIIKEFKETLENKVKELEKERDEYKQRLYNLKTRFEDYKEMIEKEKMILMYNTKKKVLERFLVPFEKLKLSLNYKDEPEFVSAVEMVYKDMVKVFDSLKMKFIIPQKGDPFDPFEHEVIDKYETNEVTEYSIYDVQTIGYKIEGEVIKPARVIVAVKPKENIEKDQDSSCEKSEPKDDKTTKSAEGIDSKEGGN